MSGRPKLPLDVFFATVVFDYNRPERGYGPEYYNLYQTLVEVVDRVELYDYGTRLREIGTQQMNEELIARARAMRPQLALFTMATDQLVPSTLDAIGAFAPTAYYAYDDTWRQEYVAAWAKHFTHVITTWTRGVTTLEQSGHRNGLYLPLACNHLLYRKKDLPQRFDVTFVGQWHPHRAWMIRRLRRAGIDVRVWGTGWPNGRLEEEAMIDVFNQSRINLNLSNDISWDARYLLSTPKAIQNTLRSRKQYAAGNQRIMEINGCGGFQLAWYSEGLEQLYEIGEEIVIFQGPEQLEQRIQFYLVHEEERERIARKGHDRTLRDHTLEARFRDLFTRLGLQRA